MIKRRLTMEHLHNFGEYLRAEEKSEATCEKYLRDVRHFMDDVGDASVTRELLAAWRNGLIEQGYAVRSVNSMLASVNSLLQMLGWGECRVKSVRIQRQTYCPEERELTKGDYHRLLKAALRRLLRSFAKHCRIDSGPIFQNSKGGALDRSTIWRKMKHLCGIAKVAATKVFPHNLRKLFARTFYALSRDLSQLADILGRSSINTTRIYIMSTGVEHRRGLERMGLVVP